MIKPYILENTPFPKNYSASFLELEYGKGCRLFDKGGNEYLDMGAGIAVNALGYGREDLAEIASAQMKKLIHTSNLFTTEPAVTLARKLTAPVPKWPLRFAAVHFGNSGAEANEAAFKYARLYSLRKYGKNRHKILYFDHGFHGRTLGALSCTWKEKYKEPYAPLLPGTYCADYNDVQGLRILEKGDFAAVIIEPLQGEGGLRSVQPEFAKALNKLCQDKDILLIADEVQTGLGRTGELYGCQKFGLEPDIITLSKPLAGGLPLSATLIPQKVNELVQVGDHGTTFGGGPVTTAVACKIWDTISDPSFLEEIREKGHSLTKALEKLKIGVPGLGEIRGSGLLQGIEVTAGAEIAGAIYKKAWENGLLVLVSGGNFIRLAPPLVITQEELSEGIDKLGTTIRSCL